MSGPPGPQGPAGPPGASGASGGLSGSYSVEQIAMYVFNIMNGEHSWPEQKTTTLELVPGLDQTIKLPLLSFSDRGIARGPPGPPGLPGPAGPSSGRSSGFNTLTVDYTALMKSKTDLVSPVA